MKTFRISYTEEIIETAIVKAKTAEAAENKFVKSMGGYADIWSVTEVKTKKRKQPSDEVTK